MTNNSCDFADKYIQISKDNKKYNIKIYEKL